MTITYFLMLFFVFWTLYAIAWGFSPKLLWHWYQRRHDKKRLVCCFIWALLGTYFFYNVW